MKRSYDCSFEMWKQFQPGGVLDAVPTKESGIWLVTEKATSEHGFVFVDETENFYPEIYKTIDEALTGRRNYALHELG